AVRGAEEEIAQDEDHGPMAQHAAGVIQSAGELGAAAAWLEDEYVADQAQHVPPPLLGRDEVLDVVREDEQPDAIVVPDGRQREHGGDLRGQLGLEAAPRAELLRAREVHDEQDRELPLLDVLLDIRMAHPGRDVPIDGADVVALLVRPHLAELHPPAAEDREVSPAEQRVHPAASAQLDQPDLVQDFAWYAGPVVPVTDARPVVPGRRGAGSGRGASPPEERAQGTSTASKMRATRSSAVTSSASAS